jgi:DNA-binding GntR family transcriptional regulator
VPKLNEKSPVPLHEQLANELRRKIADGTYDGRLPSILTLAQEYEVAHNTAARAMATLKDEGLIVAVQGKGYYVAEQSSG